uniref:Capsid protein n=1 Tax=Smacoviridae sp. TaxID=2715094 RepID=A0A6M3YP06_9VIRU|nr:MAG: capsid protein [Smacoviridae sp.]
MCYPCWSVIKWHTDLTGVGTTADTEGADATTEGDRMVQVKISETYDLSTKVGKMGIVGIHTPTGSLIDRLWPGLVLQHKKCKFVSCDVAMACASMLPADPLQIGVEAGAIAPQDMFNPILYKAVSNDSMGNFLSYIMSQEQGASVANPAVRQGSIVDINDTTFSDSTGELDQFQLYYGLLADPDGFRKAMPQAGLEMRNLYPLVYQVISNFGSVNGSYQSGDFAGPSQGVTWMVGNNDSNIPAMPASIANASDVGYITPVSIRGPSMRMPAFDCVCFQSADNKDNRIVPQSNGANINSNVGQMPPCYVGLIVLPPAKLNQLYYRLKVTWTLEFSGLRAMSEINNWSYLSYLGQVSYGTDYAEQSEAMEATTSMVDGSGATVEKIMEGI